MTKKIEKKERFVLGWEGKKNGSEFIHNVLSERIKSVIDSPHGMWNYMTYRDAIKILGLEIGSKRVGRFWMDDLLCRPT